MHGLNSLNLRALGVLILGLIALAGSGGQLRPREEAPEPRLPGGINQKEEMLKIDYKKSLEDAAELIQLAEELKAELEKNDRHVLSLSSFKKTEQIEKIAKRIRSRMKRF